MPPSKPALIAVDLGTSSVKVGVVLNIQSVAFSESCDYPVERCGERVEFDAEKVIDISIRLIEKAVQYCIDESLTKLVLGISSQRSTIVAFDESGPIALAISWQDLRAHKQIRKLRSDESEIQRRSGLKLTAHYSATKIAWLLKHNSKVSLANDNNKLRIGSLASFLIWRLTQQQVFAVDHTLAQRFQLLDIHTLKWSNWLCKRFQVPRGILPQLKNSVDDYGTAQISGCLIPIKACLGDTQAACLGMGFGGKYPLAIQYGSGAFVGLAYKRKLNFCSQLLNSITFSINQRPRFFIEGTVNQVGELYRGIKLSETKIHHYKMIPDQYIPASHGLGAPHWQADLGPQLFTSSAHSHGKLDAETGQRSIANLVSDVLEYMTHLGFKLPKNVVVGGGLTENLDFLRKQATWLNRKFAVCPFPQPAFLGLARIIFKQDRKRMRFRIVAPDKSVAALDRRSWKRVVRDAKLQLNTSSSSIGLWRERLTEAKPWIFAHRGASHFAPENTMDAFAKAIEAKAAGIELDLQLSRDGKPVAFHDNTLKRICEMKDSLSSLTSRQLADLDVGSWFSDHFSHCRIPTLEDVLNNMPKDLLIYLDLKDRQRNPLLWTHTIEEIKRAKAQSRVCLCSFNYTEALRLKLERPDLLVGAIKSSLIELPTDAQLDIISMRADLIEPRIVFNNQLAGNLLFAWTVDSLFQASHLFELDVDAIVTNDPMKISRQQLTQRKKPQMKGTN